MPGIIAAFALAVSCSLDAFTAGFAYGANKIKIPMLSIQVVNLICCAILGLSLMAGSFVRQYLPDALTKTVCCAILLVLGMAKLMDSFTKAVIRKHNRIDKEIRFSMFNFKFILKLYSDPLAADVDASKTISPAEAAALALSLSLDGLAIGFGAALGSVNILAVVVFSLVTGTAAIMLGCHTGNIAARKLPFDLSWLSGVILVALAVAKLF